MQELREYRSPYCSSGKMRTGTFFLHTTCNCERIIETTEKRKEKHVFTTFLQRKTLVCVHIASHRPVCKFVRKVTTALWLMLTRGSLLKGECQTQSHSCLAVTACAAHMHQDKITAVGSCSCVTYFALWAAACFCNNTVK